MYTSLEVNILLFLHDEWGGDLAGNDERAVHLKTILRPAPGDSLKVGLAGVGTGTAVFRGWSASGAALLEFPDPGTLAPGVPAYPFDLVLGHPRPPVLRRICRDMASFGVRSIAVCGTELGERSYFSSKFWSQKLYLDDFRTGAQQGGHVHLPSIERFRSVREYCDRLGEADSPFAGRNGIILDLDRGAPFLHEFLISRAPASCAVAVGPERGWTQREAELFGARGFVRAQLGPRIWRTESSAVYAAGIAVQVIEASVRPDGACTERGAGAGSVVHGGSATRGGGSAARGDGGGSAARGDGAGTGRIGRAP